MGNEKMKATTNEYLADKIGQHPYFDYHNAYGFFVLFEYMETYHEDFFEMNSPTGHPCIYTRDVDFITFPTICYDWLKEKETLEEVERWRWRDE